MKKLTQIFKKIYRPTILPIELLVVMYYLLVLPVENGDIIQFVLQPWGLAMTLMIISVIYIEHIFTTPKDALINSLNALIISIVFWETLRINFWVSFIFSISILISGILFLTVYDKNRKINLLSKFASGFGKAKVIFPIIAALSFIKFISDSSESVVFDIDYDVLYVIAFYLIFLILTEKDVIEKMRSLPSKLLNILHYEDIGILKGNLSPNIILVEFNIRSEVKINDLIVAGNHDVNNQNFDVSQEVEDRIGLVIDFIGTESERDTFVARIYLLNEPQKNLNESRSGLIQVNQECKKVINPESFIEKVSSEKVKFGWGRRKDIVALVTSFSNINVLKGEIVRQQQLENAQLVSCVNEDVNEPIRYQIIDAETRREGQEAKKDLGYTQFMAYQLGEWRKPKNDQNIEIATAFQRFFEFQWVPNMNSLIFKWNQADDTSARDEGTQTNGHYLLGTIPKTNLPIYLNINDLVSHHTAILGVTGTGKTTMVLKLIEAIKTNNIFTICLDITGEYRNKINDYEDFFDKDTNDTWVIEVDKIIDARKRTQYGFTDTKKITKEDAEKMEDVSIKEINKIIKGRISTLRKINKIVILEIPEISNTYFSLDFTQYVIQAILQYAKEVYVDNLSKKEDVRDNFQCCLVLEEAHTLVPENLGVGGDYGASKAVIDKISQIALQGRKYRVGFILISQRTATVKKTVLNQCNTMIAFRAYDETSFTFLSNYFGDEYVREIIHLKNDGDSRYVIVSGKAVVADRPIIVEVKK
ncbi:MAG: hypothetical protein UW30_C0020G0003 [Candidatus Giovannonibacteria bacterium GW2011_GWA2_44_13b]|uniref:AAA+ ATPase domain-containing protein n=1 Tax=Candidatus Giovannonibacteria bacterium GW2011_GWA2_44_13b TaxID=1618647 RepID=A0A0G1H167_9BACT|nr:MAG: hypothetical protein UW30_C0020G0003 [Candidatus Giovannonibacteria bacterium GW2011_GWA2_44_13b]